MRLDGEYGLEGVVLGVPCLLGPRGLVEVEEVPLDGSERRTLARTRLREAYSAKDPAAHAPLLID